MAVDHEEMEIQRVIPRIIHYVWVGGRRMPFAVRRCIDSWHRVLRGFRIIEWNESNLDLGSNRYVREALSARKWAFVSDVVRLDVVNRIGGVYLDSDCYVIRPLDEFLRHGFFSGFESEKMPFTAAFGAVSGHPLVRRLLRHYDGRPFVRSDGSLDVTTNTEIVSKVLACEYGCRLDGSRQDLREDIAIYPHDVLCNLSERSVVVHLMNWSWATKPVRRFHKVLGGGANAALLKMKLPRLYAALDSTAQRFSRDPAKLVP
jgi:hypothetical protein